MKLALFNLCFLFAAMGSCKQQKHIGGPCEGCEAIYENSIPLDLLPHTDTLPGFYETGNKLLVKGSVLKANGKPAADVVLYLYHTNQAGIYPTKGNEKGWDGRHGYLRGWIKTNKNGEYTFLTSRPGAYPGRENPEHIHITIKEPGKNEYWIDEYHFDDDPILSNEMRTRFENRGGSGVIKTSIINGIMTGNRDIILGENIPDYY